MVRLVVVDSIAALFRCEFSAKDSVLKAKYLQMFGARLHRLSSKFQIPVVCINQVTDKMDETGGATPTESVAPALGITWSNQLLMRLMVSRTFCQAARHPSSHNGSSLRTMRVIFAPHLPPSFCYYTVNLEGVRGIKEETPT
uniref:X-ray repair cross complementing 3 n=1 Tax=Varanus komodoensis TaxID=61221 RepID=A0A8D2J5T0_VARKO